MTRFWAFRFSGWPLNPKAWRQFLWVFFSEIKLSCKTASPRNEYASVFKHIQVGSDTHWPIRASLCNLLDCADNKGMSYYIVYPFVRKWCAKGLHLSSDDTWNEKKRKESLMNDKELRLRIWIVKGGSVLQDYRPFVGTVWRKATWGTQRVVAANFICLRMFKRTALTGDAACASCFRKLLCRHRTFSGHAEQLSCTTLRKTLTTLLLMLLISPLLF